MVIRTFFIILITSIYSFLQNPVYPQGLPNNKKKICINNILAYHLKHAENYEYNIDENGFLRDYGDFFFQEMLSNEYDLELKFSIVDTIVYPISKYSLFSIDKNGFYFYNSKDSIGYYFNLPSFSSDSYYLVAFNPKANKLKFLSGNFFLSKVAKDFALDPEDPDSFYDFLRIKLYNKLADEVVFLREKRKHLYFKVYSRYAKRYLEVKVNKSNPDDISIL